MEVLLEVLKFFGTHFLPLVAVLSIYLLYFNSKFKKYGNIDAQFQKLAKLEKIEKALTSVKASAEIFVKHDNKYLLANIETIMAKVRNQSEFEYHKRKEDSERLERLSTRLIDASDISNNNIELFYDSMIIYRSKVLENLKDNSQEMPVELINLISKSTNDRVPEGAEAKVLYNIFFRAYECTDFNHAFEQWYENLEIIEYKLKQTSSRISLGILNVFCSEITAQEKTVQADNLIYTHLSKSLNEVEQNRQAIYQELTKLIDATFSLSEIIRKEGEFDFDKSNV